ncbi:Uncharacterised protein [Anaerotruncus sp. 2789STDY5834896]|uniref:DUF370 domain-containing protein n=1 Tax=uncultured Anaerotruncus sp. TaxID=905011 RepID=A0A1C6J2Y0_9FIRM|nr:Uncharacterised protein [uncultured Anaerotruncus sp.]
MYIHLGQDTVVRTCDIVGIFDIDNTSVSKDTKNYLKRSGTRGQVRNVCGSGDILDIGLPKSFVVITGPGGPITYISPISPATLKKRVAARRRLPRAKHR